MRLQRTLIIMSLTFVFLSGICGATNTNRFLNELSLGGIRLGMTYKDVVAIYGNPTRIEKGTSQLVRYKLFYGNSIEIHIGMSAGEKVIGIISTANNGWSTPSGLHVGMPMPRGLVEEIFGQPISIEPGNINRPWTEYLYSYKEKIPAGYGANGMPLELSITRGITIGYAERLGKIKKLHIWKEEFDPVPVRR